MKVDEIGPISVKYMRSTPVNTYDPENTEQWPAMLVCRIGATLRDKLTPDSQPGFDREFVTRIPFIDASEPLASYEQRAKRQLAEDLRAIAAALDADA